MSEKNQKRISRAPISHERRRDLRKKNSSTINATGIENAVETIYQDAASVGNLGYMLNAIGKRLQLESLKIRTGVYRRLPVAKQLFLR